MFNMRQNFRTARDFGQNNVQAAATAGSAAAQNAGAVGRAAVGNAGDYVRGMPGAAYNAVSSAPRELIREIGMHPMAAAGVAGALGAGYVGNQMMGNPIGQGIQGVGNMINGAEWDSQYGSPVDAQGYNQLGGVGDNLYQQQVADSMAAAERAGNFQHGLERDAGSFQHDLASRASQQQYNQELGMQMNRLQSEREMQNNQLQAAQANQMLNGYVDMIQSANQRAASVAGNRY